MSTDPVLPDPLALPSPEARAKTLPRRLPIAGAAPDLVPARMINEALYCERLLYLEWAQGEFVDNAFTVEGRAAHKRADQPGGRLPPPPRRAAGDAGTPARAPRDPAAPPPPPYPGSTPSRPSPRPCP